MKCKAKKKEVKNLLRESKSNKEKRLEFLKTKKEYKEIIKKKKEQEGVKIIEEAVRDKSGKKFWQLVNVGKRKEGICKSIMTEQWYQNFKTLLEGQETDSTEVQE